MSGLAALFQRDDRPVDVSSVQAMLAVAPYLGPDGRRIRTAGPVALGFAKLALTEEDLPEEQPLVSPRSGVMIVADARLDNRDELREQMAGNVPATVSDAGIIVRAYEQWGIDAVARLLGDFAFLLWDARRQRLLCARDSSGQRPLFYRASDCSFAAATEIHQLLQDATVPIRPNEDHVRNYLTPFKMMRNEADSAATFYAGINALPAGHILMVDAARLQVHRYWELPVRELHYRRPEEYAEHFKTLFLDAVRSRLRSAYPIGATLSGGLDSSSIVCAAQEVYRQGKAVGNGFTSFSTVYPGLECDETALIRDVQAMHGFDARYIPAAGSIASLEQSPVGFIQAPGKYVSELDPLAEAAQKAGIRVLLSGEIADACLVGSPHVFDSLLRQGRVGEFRRRFRSYLQSGQQSGRKALVLDSMLPLLPLPLQRPVHVAYAERVFQRDRQALVPCWIPARLRDEVLERQQHQVRAAMRARRFANPSRQERYETLYPPEISMSADRWSMQIWRPYADRRLHEFVLAIPPEQLYEPHPYSDEVYAGSKLILRRAMRGMMPESIRTRAVKTHFAPLFEQEVQRRWPDYEAVFGPAGDSLAAQAGYIDQPVFWRRLEQLRVGIWGSDLIYIMRMMQIETWLRSLRASPGHRVAMEPEPESAPVGGGRRSGEGQYLCA